MQNPARDTIPAVPIGTIETRSGDTYIVGERLDAGGSGVVYRAYDPKAQEVEAAVKFYLVPSQAKLFGTTLQAFWGADHDDEIYNNEREALVALDHPGIQKVLGWGTITDAASKFSNEVDFEIPTSDKVEFLVSRYIDGVSITNWLVTLSQEAVNATLPKRHDIRTRIIRALISLAESLKYLHEVKHYQHSDIRSENILIDRTTQQPILIDFGFAQVFADELIKSSPTTRVRPLRLVNAPSELELEVREFWTHGTIDVSREKLRETLFPALDLYQLGRLFEVLYSETVLRKLITPLDHQFLQLLAKDLLDWKTAKATETSSVLEQLTKLLDGYWSGAAAPHAPQLAPGQPVRKIALANSHFLAPNFVKDVIETKSFRRLQQLKQLSLLDFVYPSATQTRLDHSLAVYSTAVELVQFLVRSPRFTKLFDTKSVTELLACALLHDVNHFPFLHYFQELKLAAQEEQNFFEFFIENVGSGGEVRSAPSIAEVLADAGLDPDVIIHLLSCHYGDLTDPRHQITKSILDSGVDIDKLCYVQGDARATGVPFGTGVDRQTLLSSADVLRQPREAHKTESRDTHKTEYWHLCFEPPALSAVESLLLARYWNFKRIYWHHTNRTLGAMVSYVLRRLSQAGYLDLHSYVTVTMSSTEAAAMAYLDNLHNEKFKRPSILHDLITRRAGLFKRLLSIKSPWRSGTSRTADEDRRDQIVELLQGLSDDQRSELPRSFTEGLYDIFPEIRRKVPQDDMLVLLDIPGRPLDKDMGAVFVAEVELDGHPARFVDSPFIDTLKHEFLDLSRTVRLFVPGSIREAIGKERIHAAQGDLEELLLNSLQPPKTRRRGTVR
jgi:HD superfamily phosphohydrolase